MSVDHHVSRTLSKSQRDPVVADSDARAEHRRCQSRAVERCGGRDHRSRSVCGKYSAFAFKVQWRTRVLEVGLGTLYVLSIDQCSRLLMYPRATFAHFELYRVGDTVGALCLVHRTGSSESCSSSLQYSGVIAFVRALTNTIDQRMILCQRK